MWYYYIRMKQEFSQSQIELKAHIDHTDKQPTPTQRVERLRKLKYNGGGYFRDDTIPKGTTAEIVHAPEVLEDALQLATELEAAQKELAKLQDPTAVWVNILRGTIKAPEWLKDCRGLEQQLTDKTRECEELEEKIKSDNKAILAMILHCRESGVCLDSPAIIRRMNEIDQLRAENAELKKDLEMRAIRDDGQCDLIANLRQQLADKTRARVDAGV